MSEPSDLIERARALQPLIAREADETERTRRLAKPVVSALIENGLYRMMLPRSLGGSEVPLATFMQVLEEVAKADASTAWCLGQCSVCATVSAYMDHDAAKKIWAAFRIRTFISPKAAKRISWLTIWRTTVLRSAVRQEGSAARSA